MASIKQVLTVLLLPVIGSIAAPAAEAVSAAPPATFTANPDVGPGGTVYKDSDHFRVYGNAGSEADATLAMLEAAYSCFVDTLGWRSSGLSYNSDNDNGPWWKENVYSVSELSGGAAGVMKSDQGTGLSWLDVVDSYLTVPGITVHEYGHALTYHERTWVDQTRTGAWWETLANWVADTYNTSPLCESARAKHDQSTSASEIDLKKVIGDSFQVIVDGSVDTGNYYQAWPFLTYLTSNPDNYTGLGQDTVRQLFRQYSKDGNETPLHTLARISTSASVQQIVGRYWARMAYVDIGHSTAQEVFLSQRSDLNYANLDSQADGVYKVKSTRQPRYMGANIIPLKTSGAVTVDVSVTSSGTFTATLAVRDTSLGTVRYIDLEKGSGSTAVATGEEASLVVVNTPETLYQYDGFSLTSEVQAGLDYSVKVTGATA